MSIIIPLFAALAEVFVSGKAHEEVARNFQINVHDLSRALTVARGNLWSGKFARALQNPDQRPELLTLWSLLASLEFHYGSLMAQWQRAEETCRDVRALEKPDIKLRMKADAFSFRVQQAAAKILRDMQKAEATLEKMIAKPYMSFTAQKAEDLHPAKKPQSQSASTQTTSNPIASQVEADHQSPADFSTINDDPQFQAPNPEELREVLMKHRHRIKSTPAKDRPDLIERLMRQERDSQQKEKQLAA